MLRPTILTASDEIEPLLKQLPEDLAAGLADHLHRLSDVVLDRGRIPLAWVEGNRLLPRR